MGPHVPGVGLEPTLLTEHDLKSCAATNYATRANLEARAGIEPAYRGFADLCLTTWLPRHLTKLSYPKIYRKASLSPFSIAMVVCTESPASFPKDTLGISFLPV